LEGELLLPSPIIPNFDVFETAFINVDHELETPNGIEGTASIYIEAPYSTTERNDEYTSHSVSRFSNFSRIEVQFLINKFYIYFPITYVENCIA
jgi:hypothetical protein